MIQKLDCGQYSLGSGKGDFRHSSFVCMTDAEVSLFKPTNFFSKLLFGKGLATLH